MQGFLKGLRIKEVNAANMAADAWLSVICGKLIYRPKCAVSRLPELQLAQGYGLRSEK